MESLEARLSSLEEEFLSSGGKVVLYSLEDLFEVSNGNIDIQKNDIEDSWEVVISAWENNCWIIGKTTKQAKIFEKDTITIDMFWYSFLRNHPYKMVTHGRVMSLNPQNKNRYYLLYLLSSLQYLKNRYWFDNMLTWNKIKEETIYLPTLSNWELAYDYMENYIKEIEAYHIKEIEAYHIKEIEAYLKASGLSDYYLSKDEVESLKTISMGGRKFTLDELFEKLDLKFLKKEFNKEKDISKEQTKEFNVPLVNAKAWNNGIMYYWREQDFETAELTLDVVNDWAISTWMVYPQIQKTWVLYNAYLIKPKFKHNRNLLLYFAWIVQKTIQAKFSYENKAWWNKVKEEEITLPITSDNQINYSLIETYIKATQKLVIKDLVDNINKKLETYKQII